jgi:hypothetical protein
LVGYRQEFVVGIGVSARAAWSTIVSWSAIITVLSRLSLRTRRSLLASTALLIYLSSYPEQNVQSIFSVLLRIPTVAVLDFQHVPPHVTSARLAEFDLSLDGGLQGLHIVEHQREGDQTSGNCDSAENYRAEGDHSQRGFAVLLIHSVVADHFLFQTV